MACKESSHEACTLIQQKSAVLAILGSAGCLRYRSNRYVARLFGALKEHQRANWIMSYRTTSASLAHENLMLVEEALRPSHSHSRSPVCAQSLCVATYVAASAPLSSQLAQNESHPMPQSYEGL
mmetsp:Transcript_40414/g.96408  ORF Transcript_40414/g.96408 Transcript_40414/m.96408 type:complete len:124 (+) Transcript_40414:264-635(+)